MAYKIVILIFTCKICYIPNFLCAFVDFLYSSTYTHLLEMPIMPSTFLFLTLFLLFLTNPCNQDIPASQVRCKISIVVTKLKFL